MTNPPKRALMMASVASMIDLFNTDNINILRKMGYAVDVAANFDNGSITSQERVNEYKNQLLDQGNSVYNIPIPRSIRKIRDMIRSYTMLKKLVNERQYNIVHCHSPIGGAICRLACRKARKQYGTKVIYTAHGFHFYKGAKIIAWLLFYPIEKICSYATDVLITINHEDYQVAQKFHSKSVEYVPGIGVDVNRISGICVDKRAKRAEFGLSDSDFIFMSTGQLSVRKNHEVVIRALPKLDKRIKYLIVGFGELEEKLKALVKSLGLQDRVVFAGYRRDVYELLHAMDAFAFPSLQEGLPVSLMEAMSAGMPVVCSRIRGNTDLISDGEGGFLVDCYDVEGFADGMKRISEDTDGKYGKINRNVINSFDCSLISCKMQLIYKEIR